MAEFIVGLDLGQSIDYSALAVVEKITTNILKYRGTEQEVTCHLRHLARFALGVPYPRIVATTINILSSPEFGGSPTLVIDATGIGAAVFDMFNLERQVRREEKKPTYNLDGVKITGGEGKGRTDGDYYIVPKAELLKPFYTDYGTERFVIAEDLRDREEFIRQIQAFEYEISDSGRASFGAKPGVHDDYVIAVALAVWRAKLVPFGYNFYGGRGEDERLKGDSIFELERVMKKNKK